MTNEKAITVLSVIKLNEGILNHSLNVDALITAISALESIDKLKAERDAAIDDFKEAINRDDLPSPCEYCKHLWKSGKTAVCSIDSDCSNVLRWKWRGIQNDE